MFTLNRNSEIINVYDLQSLSYRDLDTTVPISSTSDACISSSEYSTPRLYVTGGFDFYDSGTIILDDLKILNLNEMLWLIGPPSMTVGRSRHGCAVANGMLWAIGGYDEVSVEAISVTDITTEAWKSIGNLSCELGLSGITTVDEVIFIVGGHCYDTDTYSDTVYTIDTLTKSINVYEHSLPSSVRAMSVISIDYTIYGFGGYDGTSSLDSWLTLQLFRVYSVVSVH